MINSIEFEGNLTKDPEVRMTKTGEKMVTFSIANNEKYTDRNGEQKEFTEYMDVTAFKYAAEVAAGFHKGQRIIAKGKIKTNSYQNKEGRTVRVKYILANSFTASLFAPRQESNGGGNWNQFRVKPMPEQENIPF